MYSTQIGLTLARGVGELADLKHFKCICSRTLFYKFEFLALTYVYLRSNYLFLEEAVITLTYCAHLVMQKNVLFLSLNIIFMYF